MSWLEHNTGHMGWEMRKILAFVWPHYIFSKFKLKCQFYYKFHWIIQWGSKQCHKSMRQQWVLNRTGPLWYVDDAALIPLVLAQVAELAIRSGPHTVLAMSRYRLGEPPWKDDPRLSLEVRILFVGKSLPILGRVSRPLLDLSWQGVPVSFGEDKSFCVFLFDRQADDLDVTLVLRKHLSWSEWQSGFLA